MAGVGLRKPKMMTPNLRVNPSHPLSAGLMFMVGSGAYPGRVGGTGLSFSAGPYGKTVTSTGSSAFAVEIPRPPAMFDWTMFSATRMSASDSWAPVFAMPANPQNTSWASPWHGTSLMRDLSSSGGHFGANNAGSYTSHTPAGTTLLYDNIWHTYIGSWGTRGAVIYRDGVQVASSATQPFGTGAATPTINGTPEVAFCGRSASAPGGEHLTGSAQMYAYWTRRLSPKEAAMMHADPFCIFEG